MCENNNKAPVRNKQHVTSNTEMTNVPIKKL